MKLISKKMLILIALFLTISLATSARAQIAERYDIGIMSTKGLSVSACRQLADEVCGRYGIPLLVLHDLDKAGFSIKGTLQRDSRVYKFKHDIQVIDLGLRMEDVIHEELQSEPVCSGCIQASREYVVS